jgi:anti-anti-sigma regulatory factor
MIDTTTCEPELANLTSVEDALFQVELRPSDSRDVLILSGTINLDAARQLYDAALQALAGGRDVAVDWSQAVHVSAGALQVLLTLGAALHARGSVFSVMGDNAGVRRTLELGGLSGLFQPTGTPS